MKKIIIAIFFATIMLMLPLASVSKEVNTDTIKNFTSVDQDTPEVYITVSERNELKDFINDSFEEEDKPEANDIIDNILSLNTEFIVKYNVDMVELSNVLNSSYYYQPIPDEELNNVEYPYELNQLIDKYWNFEENPFGDLLNKLVEYIKNRLGWIYDLFENGYVLFIDGVTLAKDVVSVIQALPFLNLTIAVVAFINVIIRIPVQFFTEAVGYLFGRDFDGFTNLISNFTQVFTEELQTSIDNIEEYIEPFTEIFPIISQAYDYIYGENGVADFIDWILNDQPWKDEIIVSGTATLNGATLVGATVSCMGESTTTDSNGNFYLVVSPTNTSDESVPPRNWYGMHNCQITVSREGQTLKQTPKILSYVFSGGLISWTFFIIKSKTKNLIYNNPFIEILREIFERIPILFPNLFKNINHLYPL